MPFFNDVTNVRLNSCCVNTVKYINMALENGRILGPVLIASKIGLTIFSHPKDPGVGTIVGAVFSVTGGDWEAMAEAVKGIDDIVRHQICNYIAIEAFSKHLNGSLHRFWRSSADAFQCE